MKVPGVKFGVSPMNLLNVSDQAVVNALVVHWSTPWSIADAFKFEASVDRTKRKKAQRRLSMGGLTGREKGPRDYMPHLCYGEMNDQFRG